MSSLLPVILAGGVLYVAKDVLIPLSLAVLIAFLLTPPVKRLEAWHIGRIPAVLVVVFISFSTFGGLGWLVGNQLIDVINELPNYKQNIRHRVDAFRGPSKAGLAKAGESVKELTKELAGAPPEKAETPPVLRRHTAPPPLTGTAAPPVLVQLVEAPPTLLESVKSILGPLLAPVSTAVIVIVFAIVMLAKREDLRSRILRLIGQNQLHVATEAFDDAAQRVSRYLRLQFLVNSAFGALITVGLYFIGIPNFLLWGVLAGLFRFIPYLGPVLGAALPTIVALAISDHWLQPLLCLGLFLLVEPITAYVVEPALYGTHTGISSLAILVAATVWTALWGPIGLVLSTPLTVCVMVIGRYVPQFAFLYILLGDEPALSPAALVYQRLLAMDDAEAHTVIEDFLKEHTLSQLYDDLLIPALALFEEERHKGELDETRGHFLIETVEEFVAELADYTAEQPEDQEQPEAPPAVSPGIRVVCVPAGDKADEISGAMLCQVLERAGHTAISLPLGGSLSQTLDLVAAESGDVVCVSALPPFALINARSLSKALRARFPGLRIVVGLWGFARGGAKTDERLAKAFTVDVVTSIGETVVRIQTPAESAALLS
ncbi:MAG TPA: AI-2E family transporter [Candidatus Sulfopaludibacter sp.]|nr:AI-2E family transporter [Candidatus Sulfopaludibacter sp.]